MHCYRNRNIIKSADEGRWPKRTANTKCFYCIYFSLYSFIHLFIYSCIFMLNTKLYYNKSFNNMSLTVLIADWLEGHAGKQGVAGLIPGGGIHYHFEFFA